MISHSEPNSYATARPVAILMIFLAAVVFGYLSFGRLAVTLMPELTYPTLTVRTEYPGTAPEEVENDVSRPIEEALGVIGGLRRISSISRAGISDVVLEFAWDTDMSEANQEVLEKLDRVFLPEETERPLILHYDPSLDPIMELSLSGTGPVFEGESGQRRLRRIANLQVKRMLEPIKGVAAVRVRGGLEEEIHVLVEEKQLLRTGISIQQVIDRLRQENINLAGGTIREGTTEYLVRTLNEYTGLDEIRDTVVASIDGREVRIRELGEVITSHKEREIITRTDGGESVQIEIFKEGDANIVTVASRVKMMLGEIPGTPEPGGEKKGEQSETESEGEEEDAAIARGETGGRYNPETAGIAATLFRNEDVRIQVVADSSVFIEQSIREVGMTAVFGGILAVLVLFLFLRRVIPTIIIAVSIPISILITFAPMNLLGVSLNIMSLGGLAMGIGMLVDSSIVVLESIYRCKEEGDGIIAAAVRGTLEVRSAVFASTLTSIAVFLPMVFVEGIAGQAFGDLGIAVVVSLLAALVVALFFIPMLASRKWHAAAPGTSIRTDAGEGAASGPSPEGVRWDYFNDPTWERLRGWYSGGSRLFQILVWPLFGFRCLSGLYLFYFKRARAGIGGDFKTASTWIRIAGLPYWLIGLTLLIPLPFVFNWFRSLLHFHIRACGAAWTNLLEDLGENRGSFLVPLLFFSRTWSAIAGEFRRCPRWLRFTPVPYIYWLVRLLLWPVLWLIRLVLTPFLPYLFISKSWEAVSGEFIRCPVWARTLLVPLLYWLARFVSGTVFEGIGHLIMLSWRLIIYLIVAFIWPVLAFVLSLILALPLKLSQWFLGLLQRFYPGVIRWALAHPAAIVLILVACLWGTWQITTSLESELLPEVHQGEFTVEVALPVGTPLDRTADVLSPVEEAILEEKENIRSLLLTLGFDSATSQRSDEGEHTARFKVILDEDARGARSEEAVIERLRSRFTGIPDLEARVVRPVLFSDKTPIEVEIHGEDLRLLKETADQVRDAVARIPELTDVESTLRSGAPEVQIIYDRDRLALYGLNIGEVARLVRDKVKGFEATRYNLKDRRIPILVRLSMDDRETVDEVRAININPGGDRPIPLASVARVTLGEGPSEVRRIDSGRVAVIQASMAPGASLSLASARIGETLRGEIELPAGVTFFISGQNQEWERSKGSLWLALALSVFLVYVIMAAQFESLLHPLVIMLTIPMAFLGSVALLKALGISLSVVVFLGMIMLAGIVVNNAIVLVDYINTLRKRGMDRTEAIVLAGNVRLRPILMTTATTVLGLLPMALGMGDGAEIRTPMAMTVIAGLISSTVLTLVLVPSFYAIVDALKERVQGLGRSREAASPTTDKAAAREVTS